MCQSKDACDLSLEALSCRYTSRIHFVFIHERWVVFRLKLEVNLIRLKFQFFLWYMFRSLTEITWFGKWIVCIQFLLPHYVCWNHNHYVGMYKKYISHHLFMGLLSRLKLNNFTNKLKSTQISWFKKLICCKLFL